ncbi:MAG: DUF2613 domain-containing protein [Gordonia sp. (in: high G+C Gram-positive bacteria)]|uniref:DUF2613 domain-containing protein n=1 Tax=Gordonia sp. (in: high G+C Gram-positive bacteria) TaxID=84139 RepID=UPI0039E5307C
MMRDRLIYGAVAAAAGLIVGVGGIFLAGSLAAENSPSTDVNSFNAEDGFIEGSVQYGTRGDDSGKQH